jgi:hypothetical protein
MNKESVKEWNRDGVQRFAPAKKAAALAQGEDGEDYAKPGTVPLAEMWGPGVKYSDQVANGDADEDKEIQDEDDPRDPIADDDGFVNQFKMNKESVKEWNRDGVQRFAPAKKAALAQGEDGEDYSKPGTVPLAATWGPGVKYSDQVANGDKDDDKEIQDEDDPRDQIVNDEGFVNQFKHNKSDVTQWNREGVKGHKALVENREDDDEEDRDAQEQEQEEASASENDEDEAALIQDEEEDGEDDGEEESDDESELI